MMRDVSVNVASHVVFWGHTSIACVIGRWAFTRRVTQGMVLDVLCVVSLCKSVDCFQSSLTDVPRGKTRTEQNIQTKHEP